MPAGGCPSGESASTVASGCCTYVSCAGAGPAATSYNLCTDSCQNAWYEVNGVEYGPCIYGGDTNYWEACLADAGGQAVVACEK